MKRKYYKIQAGPFITLVYTEEREDIDALPSAAEQITRKEALKLCSDFYKYKSFNDPYILPAAERGTIPSWNSRLCIKNSYYIYERV